MKQLILICTLLMSLSATPARAQSVLDVQERARLHLSVLERHFTATRAEALAAVQLNRQLTQVWNEGDWENSSEVLYDYDDGRLVDVVTRTWVEGAWQNAQRTTYGFDDGRLASIQYDTWTNGAWLAEDRTLLSYENGDVSQSLEQSWENGAWVDTYRSTYTYGGGTLTGWTGETWTGSWTADERVTVGEDGGDVVYTYEEAQGEDWINVSRTRYVDITSEELLDFFMDFIQSFDQAFAYWGSLRLPDYVEQEWTGTDWVNVASQVTEYNGAQDPTTVTTYEWEDDDWVGSSRQIRSYDASGVQTETMLQAFDEGDWMTYLTESYTYYDDGPVHTVLQQFDFGGGPMNSSLVTLEWSDTQSTAVEREVPARSFVLERIYPNPFNPSATIVYHLAATQEVVLRVFDVLGRQVATLADGVQPAGRHELRFEASALPSGIYLVRLEGGGHMETRRVSLVR